MANLLTNGTFTGSLAGWNQTPSGVAVYSDGTAVFTGQTGSTVQFYKRNFAIGEDVEYVFSFVGRAAVAGQQIRVQLCEHDDPSNNLGLDATYTLTTTDATYSTTFTASQSIDDARLRFRLTNSTASFTLDNVVLDDDAGGDLAVNFSATPLAGVAPLTVDFADLTPGTVITWLWEYNKDGAGWTTFDATDDATPEYEFTAIGSYAIRLTAETATEEGTHTKDAYITVGGGIEADFTGTPTSGAAPQIVTFTDASTSTSGIDTWLWEYNRSGDGWITMSSVEDPAFNFTAAGVYSIRLTVTGDDGSDTHEEPGYITITSDGVVAGFTGTPLTGDIPFTVTFTDSSSGGTVTDRLWEYSRNGGAWVEFSTLEDPTLDIEQSGLYSIRLTVTGTTNSDLLTRTDYVVASGDDTILALYYDEYGAAGSVSAAFAFEPGVDYHIFTSYDMATGLAILYVDGEAIASENVGSFLLSGAGSSVSVGGHSGTNYLDGVIDEVVLLNRAIDPDEVRAVYESNAPVFAETSTWHWRAGRNRLWADAEGMWMVNAFGSKVIGAYAGDENNPDAFKTWGGVNLYSSDVLIGDASRLGYMLWDDSAGTLEIAGRVIITAGSEGYANLDGIPTNLADLDSTANTKLAGIETGATAGANWGVNLGLMPDWTDGRVDAAMNASGVIVSKVIPASNAAPSGDGLYLGADYMGFYKSGAWKTYMNNAGNFVFAGSSANNYIQWNATTNKLQGVGERTILGVPTGVEQWYLDATDGRFKAGGGNFIIDADGPLLIADATADQRSATESKSITYARSTGEIVGRFTGYHASSAYGINLYALAPDDEAVNLNIGVDQLGVAYAGGSVGSPKIRMGMPTNGNGFMNFYANHSFGWYQSGSASPDLWIDNAGRVSAASRLDVGTMQIYGTGANRGFVAASFDNNTGIGPFLNIGRNDDASTPAAGHIVLYSRTGSYYSLWVDNAGKLRIVANAQPTNATDTSGTIIGTQS